MDDDFKCLITNFDVSRGFDNDHPKWYLKTIDNKNVTSDQYFQAYLDIVKWLYLNIDNCEKHCRWGLSNYSYYFKFRHEKDFLYFSLVW